LIFLAVTSPAHAFFYAGGDWGGGDLTLLNGDSLSGTFSNIGRFYIPAGALISGSTNNLVVNAGKILIDGSLSGLPNPGYDLKLNSLTDLILNGSLGNWKNIWLSANQSLQINSTSTISLLDGGTLSAITAALPPQTPISVTTPLPAAAWLLGSGLLGLAGIRRRNS
jgi:hypothetical protein